ncbi:hypothetical protein AGABI1DRAFT_132271 [Agaricus bisporus var. burnettii JB137-S8]|uniref:Uncharacterized protein n=1 Tax=Agaricus bisporus var. burnettii (strain JB137-S8 / ATCC MYA-4627 / FGSC 10392) TaxID=597362 RepID=K5WJ98_AGABU|nr:uncharacterized protein AGABI1DRAFT_132271 [Agaricus bisporus var. burnettii JB137-S8]EKM75371.1 hypothetical protein AGABI1DRAFT_132271 [Agaricus bisporus var. burnettii JB137-S8]
MNLKIQREDGVYSSETEAVIDDEYIHGGSLDDDEYSLAEEPKGIASNVPPPNTSTQPYFHIRDPEASIAPDKDDARKAHTDLVCLLQPQRTNTPGYVDPQLDSWTRKRLNAMRMLLWTYVDGSKAWKAAADEVAHLCEHGCAWSRKLRKWCREYITDRNKLPKNPYGHWTGSLLSRHDDLRLEILTHLQSIGKYVQAQDIVNYLDKPDIKARWKLKKTIAICTTQRWMKELEYRWERLTNGMYEDGHEREDVVLYRQNVFLPRFEAYNQLSDHFNKDGNIEMKSLPDNHNSHPSTPKWVIWFQDESTFYMNDRRKVRWKGKDEKNMPQPKGEGVSIMISDFVSAKYGWLQSPDGNETARVIFKPGKNRGGYFTNDEVVAQTICAMKILQKYYSDERHVFIFDNATTHMKRRATAPSAQSMPLNMPREGVRRKGNWGVDVVVLDEHGKAVYNPDGSKKTRFQQMDNGVLSDGSPQSFYFEEGPHKGVFKGMKTILNERGIHTQGKRAQCPDFTSGCQKNNQADCCCRRILYNQPDFVSGKSRLEEECEQRGFPILILPKFHCELNFIEQCWGFSKRVYRQYPLVKTETEMERLPFSRFATRSLRFMDAYRHGLNGQQAV